MEPEDGGQEPEHEAGEPVAPAPLPWSRLFRFKTPPPPGMPPSPHRPSRRTPLRSPPPPGSRHAYRDPSALDFGSEAEEFGDEAALNWILRSQRSHEMAQRRSQPGSRPSPAPASPSPSQPDPQEGDSAREGLKDR